jgi:hypothetical protein
MSEDFWVPLNAREKMLLLDALYSTGTAGQACSDEIDALALKLVRARSNPQITIEVQRGLVQALGNPFPVRVCDYDIEGSEDPDIDGRGKPCRIWFEPAHPPASRNTRKKKHPHKSLPSPRRSD